MRDKEKKESWTVGDTRNPGPVVLITGAASGIGRATASLLHQRGYRVVATTRRIGDEGAVEASLVLPLDVTDESAVRAVVETVVASYGRIDALINNAGLGQRGAVEDVSTELVEKAFDVNVYGPLRLIRAVMPVMRDQGQGRIVNISSVVGRASMPMMGIYCATKFAIEALSDSLRIEAAAFGIHVSTIEPGTVRTRFFDSAAAVSEPVLRNPNSPYRGWYRWEGPKRYRQWAVEPEQVARVVTRVLESRRPRARYPVPFAAALFVWFFPWIRRLGFERVMADRIRRAVREPSSPRG